MPCNRGRQFRFQNYISCKRLRFLKAAECRGSRDMQNRLAITSEADRCYDCVVSNRFKDPGHFPTG